MSAEIKGNDGVRGSQPFPFAAGVVDVTAGIHSQYHERDFEAGNLSARQYQRSAISLSLPLRVLSQQIFLSLNYDLRRWDIKCVNLVAGQK